MSYYMEVSSCPTLPLSWVPNCPVSVNARCLVARCPVVLDSSEMVSTFAGSLPWHNHTLIQVMPF